MTETTNVLAFRQPSAVDDPLTDIVRAGARDLLARAIEIEVGAFLASTANLTLPDGRARLVRHGHGPVREIATGIPAGHFKFLRVWSVKFLHPRGRTRDC
ncbi:hypothetical protein ACVMFA_002719 [Bradyrhizobium liaoningense]